MVGQEHLLGPGRPLRRLIEADRLSSVILWGPPGTGKTTLARLIAGATAKSFETLSAVTAGVKDVREVVERARRRLGEQGQGTILFLDEVHRFNKTQQDALLPARGGRPAHPHRGHHREPLLRGQRPAAVALEPVPARAAVARGGARPCSTGAWRREEATADEDALDHLVDRSDGDARTALNALEVAVALAGAEPARGPERRPGRRRGRPRRPGPALRARRPLRRHLRLHQERPGLRPRRRALLAGPDAGGGRGRPLHRPPPGDPRLGGRRHGRPHGPGGGRRRGPGGGVRRTARGPAQPGPGRGPPGHRPQVEPGHPGVWSRPSRTCEHRPAGEVPAHLRDASYYGRPKHRSRRRATTILTTTLAGGCPRSYRPPEVDGRVYYEPSDHGFERGDRRAHAPPRRGRRARRPSGAR